MHLIVLAIFLALFYPVIYPMLRVFGSLVKFCFFFFLACGLLGMMIN
jgi:hypothetical protein